jgi:error-prone DNA polymerase
MKCHYPAAFTCALLNSQPMGFYQPAQLVQDAQRHGVKVLPVDVRFSEWDCSLEEKKGPDTFSQGEKVSGPIFLRLGLRMVKGLPEKAGKRVFEARRQESFADVQDLSARAGLNRGHLAKLAEAAALRGLAGHRHRARWEVAAVQKGSVQKGSDPILDSKLDPTPFLLPLRVVENDRVSIRPPSEVDDIRTDYASTGLTLGRHPIALLRRQLKHRRAVTARELQDRPHGSRLRACGLVTMRQRPATASGTIFLTLEDETGTVNVVIWPRLWERQRAELIGATLLAVDGVLETDDKVHHLIADRVHDFSRMAEGLVSRARDFR